MSTQGQNNNNKSNFPIWAIVVPFILGLWPIGIALIVVKILTDSNEKPKTNRQFDTFKEPAKADAEIADVGRSSNTKKKYKTKFHTLKYIGMIAAAVIGGFFSLAAIADWSLSYLIASVVLWALCGLLLFLIEKGSKEENAMNRYLRVIGKRDSMNLSRLSLVINRNHKQVMKDVQMLIDEGYFDPDSYIDVTTNNFMRTMTSFPDAPGEYYFGPEAVKRRQIAEELAKSAPLERDRDFTYFLKKLREADDSIEDAEVSDKIFKLEKISTSIFSYVEEHPEKRQEIRRFMNYYLPTTLKLLGTYSSIEKAGVSGKNMQTAKTDIENTLDKLVSGFQEQLDVLYQAEALDVATDIDVLNQMMAKDGFRRDDFSSGFAVQEKAE